MLDTFTAFYYFIPWYRFISLYQYMYCPYYQQQFKSIYPPGTLNGGSAFFCRLLYAYVLKDMVV